MAGEHRPDNEASILRMWYWDGRFRYLCGVRMAGNLLQHPGHHAQNQQPLTDSPFGFYTKVKRIIEEANIQADAEMDFMRRCHLNRRTSRCIRKWQIFHQSVLYL